MTADATNRPTATAHLADCGGEAAAGSPSAAATVTRWVKDTVLAGSPDAVILIGCAGGVAVEAIDRRAGPVVVVVEPCPACLRLLLAQRDWGPSIAEGRLAVVSGPLYAESATVARLLTLGADTPMHVCPGLEASGLEEVARARQVATQLRFASAANDQARRSLAGRYLVHTLSNAARMAREGDAAALTGLATGVPAIIAAAGPSLDRNLHDLHRVRDRALLIACDTATRPLLAAGLEPQFVVALDPSLANACHLGGLHLPRRTWLVAEGSLHPSAFVHFDRRTFFFNVADHHPWPWLRSAGVDCGRLAVWGSVLTGAFDLALRMGCSPIIFAGTDLAFTANQPYCRGTTLEAQWATWVAGGETYDSVFALLTDKWPETAGLDVAGRAARTSPHLIEFRDWLVSRAQQATGRRIVNATGDGILHGPAIELAHASDVLAHTAALDLDRFDATVRTAHAHTDRRAALFEHIAALGAIANPAALRAWRIHGAPGLADRELLAPLHGDEFSAWTLARQ